MSDSQQHDNVLQRNYKLSKIVVPELVTPPPIRTPDQWADANRTLPADSSEPGKWSTDRTPYVRPISEAVASQKYKRIFSVMMSQGGKSQGMFNAVGWKLDDEPEPVLYIGPTKGNVSQVIEPKIDQMIRGCESLTKKTVWGQKYTTFKKLVGGTSFRFAWAGSTTEIKADTAALVCVDEIDEIEIERKGQGSIIPLADARHKTYPNGLTIGCSTPTLGNVEAVEDEKTGLEHWQVSDKVSSPIWILWQAGTRHEWAVPCPKCKKYFIPRFKHLWWPKGSTPKSALKSTKLKCYCCGTKIDNSSLEWMNERGVAVSPGQRITKAGKLIGKGVESTDYTLWVSGICNPFRTWGELASNWLRAVRTGDDEAITGVINADFGELVKTGGEAPTHDQVKVHAADYRTGELPDGIRILVAGVDVQKDRLVYVIRGFGYQYESWLVEFGELWGDTQGLEIWLDLEELLEAEIGGRSISLMLIDSGYRANDVYQFARNNKARARATKGHDKADRPFYSSKVDVTISGKVKKNGLQLWHYCTDTMKSWVHGRVSRDRDLPGQWWLPSNITTDYCKQIIAEERIEKPSGATSWIKVAKDNHYLDAEALAYLGARMLSTRLIKPDTKPIKKDTPTPEQAIRKNRRNALRQRRKPSWRRL